MKKNYKWPKLNPRLLWYPEKGGRPPEAKQAPTEERPEARPPGGR